jgi:hypothetical protein
MIGLLFANILSKHWWDGNLCYSLPLILAISLVYAATRHERMSSILLHAGRVAGWIIGFMVIVFVVISLVTWYLV